MKSCINIKNNNQKFESNNINIKNKKYKIENIVSENVKEIKNDNIFEIVLNYSLPRTVKIHGWFDNMEKEFENKPLILYQNNIYDFQSNNRYNISKKIIQLRQRDLEESIEITMQNKDNNINDEYFDSNNIKDNICDEMISQNFGAANSLIRSTTNDYINKLGFKNNVLWSEN